MKPAASMLGLALMLATGAAFAADDSLLQQKINACHAIADRDVRMSCYDRLAEPVMSATVPSAPALPAQPAPKAGMAQSAPPVAPPQPSASVAMQVPPAPPPPQPSATQTSESLRSDNDEILIAIASVSAGGNKSLSFVTSDGIPWEKTDEKRIHEVPAAGDLVKISRGYLGYTCKFSKSDKFRCRPPHGLNGRMRRVD